MEQCIGHWYFMWHHRLHFGHKPSAVICSSSEDIQRKSYMVQLLLPYFMYGKLNANPTEALIGNTFSRFFEELTGGCLLFAQDLCWYSNRNSNGNIMFIFVRWLPCWLWYYSFTPLIIYSFWPSKVLKFIFIQTVMSSCMFAVKLPGSCSVRIMAIARAPFSSSQRKYPSCPFTPGSMERLYLLPRSGDAF